MDIRCRKTRARQIILGSLTLIVTAQLFASWLIDRAPLAVRFAEAAKVAELLSQKPDAKNIVFFGTSRTRANISDHLVIQELAPAGRQLDYTIHNGAVSAGDPIAIKYLHERLAALGIEPALAVIEILPETLSHRNAWMGFHIERQYRWSDVFAVAADAWRGGRFTKLVASRLMPLSFYRYQFQVWLQQILNLDLKASVQAAESANHPARTQRPAEGNQVDVEGIRVETAKKRVRSFKIGGAAARDFELLLGRLQKSQAKILLLSVPLPSAYRSAYEGEVEAVFSAYIQQLQGKYGLKYYDYRSRLPDRLFKDRYYLNGEGRAQFSRLIATEVLGPQILPR